MEIRYFLDEIQIDEPIGMDDFQLQLKRGDEHGIGIESSVGELEFSGASAEYITEAYEADLDTEIKFKIEIKCNKNDDWLELYTGVIDLTTYVNNKKEYCSVYAKVADIGAKTTFNNRVETSVNVESNYSIDDVPMPGFTSMVQSISIPAKLMTFNAGCEMPVDGQLAQIYIMTGSGGSYKLPFGSTSVVDFGSVNQGSMVNTSSGNLAVWVNQDTDLIAEDITADVTATAKFKYSRAVGSDNFSSLKWRLYKNAEVIYEKILTTPTGTEEFNVDDTVSITDVQFNIGDSFCSALVIGSVSGNSYLNVTILEGSKFNISTLHKAFNTSEYDYSSAKSMEMFLVADIFRQITNSISGLKFKSDWFDRFDSDDYKFSSKIGAKITENSHLTVTLESVDGITVNHKAVMKNNEMLDNELTISSINGNVVTFNEFVFGMFTSGDVITFVKNNDNYNESNKFYGDGALKAVSSGVKLRGIDKDFALSFKDVYQAMNAIDALGWGFDGENVRVEPMSWFYKNVPSGVEIEDIASISKKVDSSSIYSQLICGYNTYSDEVNSQNTIESIFGSREFTSGLKAIDNKLEEYCKFIADPFLIEEIRKLAIEGTSESNSSDDKVFVFALSNRYRNIGTDIFPLYQWKMEIDLTSKATGLSDENTINLAITPWRNALRWGDKIITRKNTLKFLTGNANLSASITTYALDYYPYMSLGARTTVENSNITLPSSIIKPELVTFDNVLSALEWNLIKNNPYAYILVNSQKMYVSEIKYSPITGKANFSLIPKYDN